MDINISIKNPDKFDFTKYPDAVNRGLYLGLQEVKQRTVDKLISNLNKYGLGSSSFVDSIETEDTEFGFIVKIAKEYVMYVEFGTGIVGSEHPHPHPWEYDVNDHGEDGWFYINGGKLYHTFGQPSRPFLYETWLWASRSANSIIMKNIRREIKKVSVGE